MSMASIAGTVTRVDRRGKQIVCFEGHGLHKVGRGESVTVDFGDATYTGELVAIAPGRAIMLISQINAEHGVLTATAAIA